MNAPTTLRCPTPRDILLRNAKQDVRQRYDAKYTRLLADMQRDLDELDRKFYAGEAF